MPMHLDGPAFQNIRGKKMVRQQSKRHLSFEQLDARIAMNSDSYPLRSVGFELPSTNHARSNEVRGVIIANRLESVEIQQVGIQQIGSQQIGSQQIATFRILPRYDFVRFIAHPSLGKMIGEGEGPPQAPPSRSIGNGPAEGELPGKTIVQVHEAESSSFSAKPVFSAIQSSESATVKQDLQPSAARVGQNQSVSRPESSLPKPISLQPQASEIIASSALRTASASPLSDNLSSKRDFNSVSVTPQVTFLQSKSSLNELASVTSNAKGLAQTGVVFGPKTESAKPTKEGMLSFAMDGGLRAESELSNGAQSKASRLRTQQQSEVLLRQMQRAQVESIIDELAVNAKRLPVPKGMIEIRDHVENSQRQGVVAKASANPFEILQLFIGSTNMVQSRSESDAQAPSLIGIRFDSEESAELASKEDILVTLGIGAVLAIAIRESRVRRLMDPFFATLRRPVAQAT